METVFEDNIYWGTRWLYHKAQVIREDGNRSWLGWDTAVEAYNGGGDKNYVSKVYTILSNGPSF